MEASERLATRPGGAGAPADDPGPGALRAFAFDAIAFFVLVLVINLVLVSGWHAFAASGATPGGPGILALMAMTLVGTGGAAVILYRWRRRATPAEQAASARAARKPATWAITVLVGAMVFGATKVARWLILEAGIDLQPTNLPLIEQGLLVYPGLVLVFAAVLAPAYEELVFRRVLFGRLLAAGRPWLGIVLSSAVFALMHELPFMGSPIAATLVLWLVYGGMGAAFAWLYWRTGTLWAPIAAHGLHNLASLLLLLGAPA